MEMMSCDKSPFMRKHVESAEEHAGDAQEITPEDLVLASSTSS